MKMQTMGHASLLRIAAAYLVDQEEIGGKNLPAIDPMMVSQLTPRYPKNMDVKHIRPSLSDRIDLALLEFPGRTALLFAALASLVATVATVMS